MPKGIVQYFLQTKGFGYIRIPETREEIYVHQRDILEPIKKGDIVTFEIGEDKQGLYAQKVQVVRPLR